VSTLILILALAADPLAYSPPHPLTAQVTRNHSVTDAWPLRVERWYGRWVIRTTAGDFLVTNAGTCMFGNELVTDPETVRYLMWLLWYTNYGLKPIAY